MKKQTWFNLIGIILGTLVIGTLIWYKLHYSPKEVVNIRDTDRQSAEKTAPSLPPVSTSAPLNLQSLSGNDLALLQAFLKQIQQEKNFLLDKMLPPAQHLFERDPALLQRWYNDPSWPNIQYYQVLKEYRINRSSIPVALPESFLNLTRLIENAEDTFLAGLRKFDFSPEGARAYPPDELRELHRIAEQIDKSCREIEAEMKKVDDSMKIKTD